MKRSAQRLPTLRTARGVLAISAAVLCGAGCQEEPEALPPEVLMAMVPVTGRHLDRASPTNAGLLRGLQSDGLPLRTGTEMDPLILETRRYYDALALPGAEAQSVDYPDPIDGSEVATRQTAPVSLQAWKTAFGFPLRGPAETVDAYRARTGMVVYYNKNELALGRELGCAEFRDGEGLDQDGSPRMGLACFVTNYGVAFRDPVRSLAMTVDGSSSRNTVCITYRPSMEPGYQVQFYTYGSDGNRQEWAQLDTLGPRPHPMICLNCHGGSYDRDKHLAKDARFLPLDPNLVTFVDDAAMPHLGRSGQEESMRAINAASTRTPLTRRQKEMLDQLYLGQVTQVGQASQPSWAPPAWQQSGPDADLFDRVLKPYCTTCHLAISGGTGPGATLSAGLFDSAIDLQRPLVPGVVCGSFSMPNAQPTLLSFWDTTAGPVTVGDQVHPSAADALLAFFGQNRTACTQLPQMGTCDRGAQPDSLCGNAHSGFVCDRPTGRCLPGP